MAIISRAARRARRTRRRLGAVGGLGRTVLLPTAAGAPDPARAHHVGTSRAHPGPTPGAGKIMLKRQWGTAQSEVRSYEPARPKMRRPSARSRRAVGWSALVHLLPRAWRTPRARRLHHRHPGRKSAAAAKCRPGGLGQAVVVAEFPGAHRGRFLLPARNWLSELARPLCLAAAVAKPLCTLIMLFSDRVQNRKLGGRCAIAESQSPLPSSQQASLSSRARPRRPRGPWPGPSRRARLRIKRRRQVRVPTRPRSDRCRVTPPRATRISRCSSAVPPVLRSDLR